MGPSPDSSFLDYLPPAVGAALLAGSGPITGPMQVATMPAMGDMTGDLSQVLDALRGNSRQQQLQQQTTRQQAPQQDLFGQQMDWINGHSASELATLTQHLNRTGQMTPQLNNAISRRLYQINTDPSLKDYRH